LQAETDDDIIARFMAFSKIADIEKTALDLWEYLISKYDKWDFYIQKNLK
jgi:hypothetical protein